MSRTDNYAIQAQSAKDLFLTYDQAELIEKFHLEADESYLYPVLLGQRCRLNRKNGDLERESGGVWRDANSFEEVMTLLDILCDAKKGRFLSNRWKSMQDFGLMFHRNLLEDRRDIWADRFDKDPAFLHRGCQALGGKPLPGGDISYSVELFDGLAICVQFWHGDEEFIPRLRYLWDENATQYIRYETMYYAINLLLRRIREEAEAAVR